MAAPASRPSFDRLFFIVSGVILLAIIAINGWSLWRRNSAPSPAGAAAEPSPEQSKDAGPATAEAVPAADPGFVGPVRSARAPDRTAKRATAAPRAPDPPLPAAPSAPATQAADATTPAPTPAVPERGAGDAAPVAVKPFYSAADRDVTPPRALSPMLISMLSQESPGVRPDVMNIAVVINEQGTVDSVQAVNNPETIGESVMLTAALSAVKSWHFRPALRNGTPVKYRQIVPVRVRPNP